MATLDATYNAIQKKLQDDGEWDRLYESLSELLNESGWIDELYDSTKERSRANTPLISQLLSEFGPSSTKTIPAEVRAKVLAQIKEAIEKIVD